MSGFDLKAALFPTTWKDALIPPLLPGFKGSNPIDIIRGQKSTPTPAALPPSGQPYSMTPPAAASPTGATATPAPYGSTLLTQQPSAAGRALI